MLALQGQVLIHDYILLTDIDVNGKLSYPIACNLGSFNGQGYSISNIKQTAGVNLGLFSSNVGKIENVIVDNVTIAFTPTGKYLTKDARVQLNIGAIASFNFGEIINCSSSVVYDLDYYTEAGKHLGGQSNLYYIGGLVGNNKGLIDSCNSQVSITTHLGSSYIGGLVGINSGTVCNSSSSGECNLDVSYDSTTIANFGGLIGSSSGTVEKSYSTVTMQTSSSSNSGNIGGLIGLNSGYINNCYATGAVTATTPGGSPAGVDVGGLVGYNTKFIYNSYATGNVSAIVNGRATGYNVPNTWADCWVGGLVGSGNSTYNGEITIQNCFATGNVSGATNTASSQSIVIGGLVGSGNCTNSYISSTQKISTAKTTSYGTTTGSTPSNTKAESKSLSTIRTIEFYTDTLGWSAEIWDFSNGSYPTLK